MLLALSACPTAPEEPIEVDADGESSYFQDYLRNVFFRALGEELVEKDDKIKARAKRVRERGECPPLRVTVDGEEVNFPYAYASLDEENERLELSVLDGDIVSCNGIRLPAAGRNDGLISFRDAYARDKTWTAPESVIVEEIQLAYAYRGQRFSSLKWRGGSVLFQNSTPESQPVLLSDSISDDIIEVCIPPQRIKSRFRKGRDNLRTHRSEITIEGTVHAKMCGPRMSNETWHEGNLDCDPFYAEESGKTIKIDLFVDPEEEFGIIGFRQESLVTCDSLADQDRPLISTRVRFGMPDVRDIGIADSNATDGESVVSNGFVGNSISPLGPRAERRMCLHRPLYWHRQGKTGFMRGTLDPRFCRSKKPAG